jgi:hypothetical protein
MVWIKIGQLSRFREVTEEIYLLERLVERFKEPVHSAHVDDAKVKQAYWY